MRWQLAISLVLLVASATAQEQDGSSWSAKLRSWGQTLSQHVNQIGKQAGAVRNAIGRQLESLNATLQSNDDLIAQLVPPETAQGFNDALDVLQCIFRTGCRLQPSTTAASRSRRALVAASRELTGVERQQARVFLDAVSDRVRREVFGDMLNFANRVSDGLNEALGKVRGGVQQARDGVEQVRSQARDHVTTMAERTRSVLRCYLAATCGASARSARSVAAEVEIAERAAGGALVVKRSLRRAWPFDGHFIAEFFSAIVNSDSVEDVDRAVDLLRDALHKKIDALACLVAVCQSTTTAAAATPSRPSA